MLKDENVEIYSWCPFAGRPTDPRYIACYDPDEEHKPQVFTTGELCNHVYVSHHEMYQSFCEQIEYYIKQYLCEKDGRRIEVSTIPLDLTYVKNELSKALTEPSSEIYTPYYKQSMRQLDVLPETIREKIEKCFKMGGSITNITTYLNNITPDEPRISKNTLRAYMERHHITPQLNSDRAEEGIVDCILQVLSDNPVWVGTPTELHSKMRAGNIVVPIDPSRMSRMLNQNKEHLLNNDIQVSRYSRIDFPDGRHIFNGVGSNRTIIVLQRKVDGKFKSFKELCANLSTSTQDHSMSEIDDVSNGDFAVPDPKYEAERIGCPKVDKYTVPPLPGATGERVDEIDDDDLEPRMNRSESSAEMAESLGITIDADDDFDLRMGHRGMEAVYETTSIVKNNPMEVIGLSILKQSMVEIPDGVVSRIGVKDGDRVLFIDDGKNIIIRSAKYIGD